MVYGTVDSWKFLMCLSVCLCVCVCLSVCLRVYVCMHMYVRECVCMSANAPVRASMCECLRVCAWVCVIHITLSGKLILWSRLLGFSKLEGVISRSVRWVKWLVRKSCLGEISCHICCITADCTSLAPSKQNSGKPQLIYHTCCKTFAICCTVFTRPPFLLEGWRRGSPMLTHPCSSSSLYVGER